MPDVTVHWRSGESVVQSGEGAHRDWTVSVIAANGLNTTVQIRKWTWTIANICAREIRPQTGQWLPAPPEKEPEP